MKKQILLIISILIVLPYLASAQDLTGQSLSLYQDPGSDQIQSLTTVRLTNRGAGGNPYTWNIYTAAAAGGYGVRPNAFEIWEYPPYPTNPDCCIQRFVIDKSPINSAVYPAIIDNKGGLALGGFSNAGNNMLSVDGNVGIGTLDTKGYLLAVNGGIHSQSVNVDLTGWSDYVFKKEYQLLSLTEVKAYIDQNHHLPDMPSEQEVVKKGINLGEMNKLLTKKMEELTLYLIEEDKQNKQKDVQLQNQQKQIDELKQQVTALLNLIRK